MLTKSVALFKTLFSNKCWKDENWRDNFAIQCFLFPVGKFGHQKNIYVLM